MNINVSIDKNDLLKVKSLLKECQKEFSFNKFCPSLLIISTTLLFTVGVFLFVFLMSSNNSIKNIVSIESFRFVLFNLICLTCFIIFLASCFLKFFTTIGKKRFYIIRYKYLTGNFSIDFIDNQLVLNSNVRKIRISLKDCNVKIENDILILRDNNNFIIILPLYKIEERNLLVKKIHEIRGGKNI